MVDAAVSFAVKRLGDFLIREVSLCQSLRKNVLWLKDELDYMQSFLQDAQNKQTGDRLVQQWVFDITCVANEAMAILEDYSTLDKAEKRFADRLKACACICQKEVEFRDIGNQILSLKERVVDISRKKDIYGITSINNNAGEGPSSRPNNPSLMRTVSYAGQDQIFIGFEEVFQRLLAEVVKEEPCRAVLSIYGMGGLGKTALARKLYNSPDVLSIFSPRAWICVSQQYSTSDLLQSIIKSIQGRGKETLETLNLMTGTDLEGHLRDLLENRKYLVVVDDVWTREAWDCLKRSLPDSNSGSRVILTTRIKDVAERVSDKGFCHKLRFLNGEESWDLFCQKLHKENKNESVSPAMERLATKMVEKCRGLPLAIVVLGGLLAHKKGVEEWKKVKAQLWQHVKKDSVEITHILSMSYNDLSPELKQCFLYFGIFPEDHEIDSVKLVRLWLAEGFIPMEDNGENFLEELMSRGLIHVADTFFERITHWRIHDLLRDLVVQKATEANLFDIYDPKVNSLVPFRHRHAIHTQTKSYLSLDLSKLKVRSVLLFDKEVKHMILETEIFKSFCKMFRYLYVLDLDEVCFSRDEVPDAIGNLVHLKFLGLSSSSIHELPPSIGNLKSLQTLQFYGNNYCRLPPQISQLTNLRHLIVRYYEPLQIGTLVNLRTLKCVCCDQWKSVNIACLVNLQELRMDQMTASYSLRSIGSLKSLTTLSLECSYGENFPPFEPLSSCADLHRLSLEGRINEVAELNNLPKSITLLELWVTELKEDPMPILGLFPNLTHLVFIHNAYKGNKLTCEDNSFCQLTCLRLGEIDNLESLHLGTNAMPLIKCFYIRDCRKLKTIPQRLKDVAVFTQDAFYK